MSTLRLLYRDFDRAPYLYTLKHAAARRGLTLDITKAQLGGRYGEYLVEGATDLLAENYWGLQNLRHKGIALVSLATAVATLNEKLFVHPSVTSIDGLRGRKLAIRGIGPSQFIPRLWLRDNGLGRDVEPVVYSEEEVGRWGQWKKVVSGECHGTFVTNFYQDEPAGAGLRLLPIEPYGFIGNVTLTTTEKIVAERRDDIQVLVSAAFDATHTFRNDPALALAICREEPMQLMEIKSAADMVRLYEILRAELSEEPVPTVEAISNTWRMCLDSSPELASFNPLLMWDFSFAQRAKRA